MFTGLIEEIGKVTRLQPAAAGLTVTIEAPQITGDLKVGDSVAVEGICLTVTALTPPQFTVDAVHETLKRSTLGNIKTGVPVNLERALRVGDRLGGHFVQGHVDGVGRIEKIESTGNMIWLSVAIPEEFGAYVIEKGSIALDGISLTVAKKEDSRIGLAIIPHTFRNTTLQFKRPGDGVNLEFDMIAKYIENLLRSKSGGASKITDSWLQEQGFI